MSLASVYAAAQTTQTDSQVTVDATEPPALEGPNARFSVTKDGNMLVTPKGSGVNEATPAQALAVAAWITATFG